MGDVAIVANLCWFAAEQLRHVSPRLFKSGLARRAEKVRRRGVAERIFQEGDDGRANFRENLDFRGFDGTGRTARMVPEPY